MTRFLAGLVLSTPLPVLCARLRASARTHELRALTVVAAGPMEGSGLAATSSPAPHPPVVRSVEGDRPPDTQPDVTPLLAKAGRVRRAELAPPCHDCNCCRVYAGRMAEAHREIDRLRDDLVRGDSRRINHRGTDPGPFGSPVVPWQASS